VADDKLGSRRRLKELLMAMSSRRDDLEACRNKGDVEGVARCERALELNYSFIREHCAKHHLKRPHDVPFEAHPTTSDTE